MNTSVVQGLEQQLEQAKELRERRQQALRLASNRDFKKLILESFITTEAARLVAQSADPSIDAKMQADALSMAQAGGHLKRFLSAVVQMGATAEDEIRSLEEALEEARAEELEVDSDNQSEEA